MSASANAPGYSVLRRLMLPVLLLAAYAPDVSAGPCTLKRVTELPIVGGQNPVVPLQMNGQPRRVLIDTGGFWSMMNPALAAGLETFTSPVSGRLGLQGAELTKAVRMPTMQLGPALFKDVEFLVQPPDYADVDATLGAEWLKTFDLEINPVRNTVSIFEQTRCGDDAVYWTNSGIKTIHFNLGKGGDITLPVRLDGEEIRAALDTGSSQTALDSRTAERLFNLTADSPGAHPNADKTAFEYQFKSLDLGGYVLDNPKVEVTRIRNGDQKIILGMSDLHRMHFYIDYRHERIYATDARSEFAMQQAAQAATAQLHTANPGAVAYVGPIVRALNDKRFDDAQAALDSALKIDPDYPELYMLKARIHAGRKDYDHALEDAQTAVRLGPTTPMAYRTRAEAYADKGDFDHAIQDMTTAMQLQPNNILFYLFRSDYYAGKGDFPAAAADIDTHLKMMPANPSAVATRCKLEGLMGRYDSARAMCKAGLKTFPDDTSILQARAYVNLRAGKLDDAIDDYDRALGLFPDLAMAQYGRGIAERLRGDKAKGDADVSAALVRFPDLAQRFDK